MKILFLLLFTWGTCLFYSNAQSICPNNLVTNGDTELGNPTLSHEDIANATGFGPIWTGSNWAEHYPSTFAPAGYTPPAPASGNYISCWIANSSGQGNRFREGFKGSLDQPITAHSGWYDLSFDIACLGGWGNAEIAVYGVYDPNNTAPNRPTDAFTPSNHNLFGPNNTILLGTIPINLNNYNHNKTRQTISFNSSNFPSNGITHFFVTNSDNNTGGIIYTAFDNFCISSRAGAPEPCPELDLLQATCIPDVDGDYKQDYSVVIQVQQGNRGILSLSTGCGRVTPSNIVLNGQAFYTVTITNSSCSNFSLNYAVQLDSSTICPNNELNFELPDCLPICVCDDNFYNAVSQGFSYQASCTRDSLAPVGNLTNCDEVDWFINGNHIASSLSNNLIVIPHLDNSSQVCMQVNRMDEFGNVCTATFCNRVGGTLNCLTLATPNSFQIAPNPAPNFINLRWNTTAINGPLHVELYTIHGILSKRWDAINGYDGKVQLDIHDLPTGIYWVVLRGAESEFTPVKIIKQ